MSIEVRRSAERFRTRAEGRTTRHSFSFGAHYDPANTGFGSLVAHNDELLPPGTGYPDHPHRDIEIVTWVLEGALRHTDSTGHTGVLTPGEIQLVSAGTGILHSEITEPGVTTRFIQAWIRPDESGLPPSHGVAQIPPTEGFSELVGPDAAVPVNAAGARLYLGQLTTGSLPLPDAPRLHVFVASGSIQLGEHLLGPSDTARMLEEGGRRITVRRKGTVAVWALG